MLELGTFGSVRGAPGNGCPYRNPRPEADVHQRLVSDGLSESAQVH